MSNGNKEFSNIGFMLSIFGPSAISAMFAIITKPLTEKSTFDALRKNFLETIRFRMAAEIAVMLPPKTGRTVNDDYVSMCKTKLNEYFANNSVLLVDFLYSEKLYMSYGKLFIIFKYAIVLIPVVAILCGIILIIYFRDTLSIKNCGLFVFFSLVFVFATWLFKERRRDQYSDLCSKYEVVK